MGIENRDYVRGGSSSYSGGYSSSYGGYGTGGMPPGCKWILIITVVVFLGQSLWKHTPSKEELAKYQRVYPQYTPAEINQKLRYSVLKSAFSLAPDDVFPGFQVWRLVTYAFCHSESDLSHLFFNMLMFWFLAPTLERMYGTREFVWFYLMGAAVAGLAFIGLEMFLGQMSPVVGASGAVMAVVMLYAVHYPRQVVYVLGIIPIEIRWLAAIFVIHDLYPILQNLSGQFPNDNVAHSAHLGGLAFGYCYFKFQLRFDRLFGGFKLPDLSRRPKPNKNIRLYEPPDASALDEQVDAILEKITQSGEASLTDHERETLKAASQRYKKRL